MSFSSPINDTPQTIWEEQKSLGARMMLTIPFGSSPEKMLGFISVIGDRSSELPVLTLCVDKPSGGAIVSTVVFDSSDRYNDFVSKLLVDYAVNFEISDLY
jgi:hypothetical protein